MKRIIFPLAIVLFIVACNQNTSTSDTDKDSAMAMSHDDSVVKYPYSIEHPDQWETGSRQNTVAALNALKAFENGNIDESMNYFGDSVHLLMDNMDMTLSKDSLTAMLKQHRGQIKTMEIQMDDWESVISKDKDKEYVSLWYKQIWEMNDGKKDSIFVMDDLRMKNGKIVSIDEKSRKLGTAKM